MSASVDSRIVTMKFDNSQFENGVKTSISTLDRLKAALSKLASHKSGMDQLNQSAKNFDVGPMGAAVDGVSKKFLALSTVAITALANITNRAVDAGLAFGKSFTIQPVIDGLHEYETNLKSIQTIQANTDAPLKEVNAALEEMNRFSDQTIYNFGEMAKNVGTFTAAGVDLETATSAIKGIANIAALSGSSSEQAATAMYQLSQAIAAGKVGLMDWNSVVNAGMGGKKLQNALAQTAVAMGDLGKNAVKMVGPMKTLKIEGDSFRDSISAAAGQESWLSSDVLTATLEAMDGSLSQAALAASGLEQAEIKEAIAAKRANMEKKYGAKYTDEAWAGLVKMADASFRAATESKTLGDVISVARESIGSGWSESFKLIIGDLKQAKNLWTSVAGTFKVFIDASSNARNEMLKGWKKNGGRIALLDAFRNGFQALMAILRPIKEAFRDIFPAKTGKDLADMTKNFRDFMESLKPGPATVDNIKRTFRGLFAVLHIGWEIIKGVAGFFGELFANVAGGEGGILSMTANIGDFLVNLDKILTKEGLLDGFFSALSAGADGVGNALSFLSDAFSNLFEGLDGSAILGAIGDVFASIGSAISSAVSNIGGGNTGGLIAAGLGGAIFLAVNKIKNMLKGGLLDNLFGGAFSSIAESFGELTGVLEGMQQNLKAGALLKIAGAVGILAASMLILSTIKSKNLAKALGAMAGGFALLMGSMALMTKIGGPIGFSVAAAGMVALASAMLVLSVAMKIMASMNLKEIGKGLLGVAGALAIMVAATAIMSKNTKGLFRAGAAILMMSVGLLAISTAMKIMASMSMVEMGKGLLGIAGALVILAGAMRLMPKNMLMQSIALVAVGAALNEIAVAMKILGAGSWESIGKSMVALGGALLVLGIGLRFMNGTLMGSAALVVAAAALAVLTPVLVTLGSMSWESIAKGLVAIAGALTILGVAGAILGGTGIVFALMGLGAAIALIGAGAALAGLGMSLLVGALENLVALGGPGIQVLVDAIKALLSLIPYAMIKFAEGIVGFARVIAENGPAFTDAFVTMINSLLDAVIKTTPKIGRAITVLIQTGLRVIRQNFPTFVNTGFQLLMNLLNGISKNIGRITKVVVDIVVKFINTMANNLPRIIQSGVNFILKFIDGLTRAIDNNSERMGRAGGRLAVAIVRGMANGLRAGASEVINAAVDMASSALSAAKDKLKIFSPSREFFALGKYSDEGMALGFRAYSGVVSKASASVADDALVTMKKAVRGVSAALNSEMDASPTIAPVLDLTQFRKDAQSMSGAIPDATIGANLSFNQANSISNDQASAKDAQEAVVAPGVTEIKFEQHNHSPEALSATQIYRNTKNLLSLEKEALKAS